MRWPLLVLRETGVRPRSGGAGGRLLLLLLRLLGVAVQVLGDLLPALAVAAVLRGISHHRLSAATASPSVRQRTENYAPPAETDVMNLPKLPAETSPFIWGAVTGAAALAIIGFTWGGWVSGGTAERLAGARGEASMLAALAPICVAQFQKNPKAVANLASFKEARSWEQADFVRNGGWATMPGATGDPSRDVASACADALNKL